ncbi:hypothetical protein TNCV_4164391 [Trichonephila clavipes]|nr:hypothetical protein TNCV_4164391 [Trichonephila clavipes]
MLSGYPEKQLQRCTLLGSTFFQPQCNLPNFRAANRELSHLQSSSNRSKPSLLFSSSHNSSGLFPAEIISRLRP